MGTERLYKAGVLTAAGWGHPVLPIVCIYLAVLADSPTPGYNPVLKPDHERNRETGRGGVGFLRKGVWPGEVHSVDLPGLQVLWHTGHFSSAALSFLPFPHTSALCVPIPACTHVLIMHFAISAHTCVCNHAPVHPRSRLSLMCTLVRLRAQASVLVLVHLCFLRQPFIHSFKKFGVCSGPGLVLSTTRMGMQLELGGQGNR